MARTTVLPTDPIKRKAWASHVYTESAGDQYFSRLAGAEGSRSAIITKTDVEKGVGDEIVTTLVASLRGTPVIEGEKLAGREFRLNHSAHTMRVNVFRQGVNIGAKIDQARVGHNLSETGRNKLSEYIKDLKEETVACAMSGARGIGDEVLQLGPDYVGYPNLLRAPDAAHAYIGRAGDKTKATLDGTTDKLALTTINKLRTKSKKMLGGSIDKASKMTPIKIGGKDVFVLSVCPEGIQDIRDDSGTQGWFEAQRALTTAIGKESDLFKGGAGMFNGVLVDEMETCVKFSDYGSGGVTPAARALFMGANAGFIAHGTKGMADGMKIALDEDTDDRGYDNILFFQMIFGADKTAFNGMDYGLISVDHAFTAAV